LTCFHHGSRGLPRAVTTRRIHLMRDRPTPPIPAHPDVVIESDKRVWSGRFPLDVVKFRQRRFDGVMSKTRIWELWRRGRASALLPYDPWTDQVVMIEQFRLPALAAAADPVLVESGRAVRGR